MILLVEAAFAAITLALICAVLVAARGRRRDDDTAADRDRDGDRGDAPR